MSDDAERLYELRDELDRDTQMFADAAGREMSDSIRDESGAVTVRIDAQGLLSIGIADDWRDRIEPSGLGDRIVETFQTLKASRLEAWGSNIGDATEQERRATPIPSTEDSVAAKLQRSLLAEPDAAPAVEKLLENVLGFLDDVSANLDATFTEATARGRRSEEVAPISRNLSVEFSVGGDLVALSLSAHWVQRSSGAQITREVNDALREAFEGTQDARESGPLAGTPLEKYGRLVDDPDAFVAFLTGKD